MSTKAEHRVIYRDRDLLVVEKPHGMPSQKTQTGLPGLIEAVQQNEPNTTLPHRLDQPASGLLVLARSDLARAHLAKAFRRHNIQRSYAAVLYGRLPEPAHWSTALDGKAASTQAHPISQRSGFTAARIHLETGRFHQIRRHAAMAGVPIVGDRRYGNEAGLAWPRLALHAFSLTLTHPATGETLTFNAEIPDDMIKLWSLAGAPADLTCEERAGQP